MTKKKYFTISKKNSYGYEVVFRFENLDGAIGAFKYLMEGKAIEVESKTVPDKTKTPDEDGYVSSTYIQVEKGESEYHLGSEIIDVYTQEEFNQIAKDGEEWRLTFKKEKKK